MLIIFSDIILIATALSDSSSNAPIKVNFQVLKTFMKVKLEHTTWKPLIDH
uniref:Uncharacterized protein n=1 Tax=Moniliophthora roreri TaxID=221103 RepID=A0A0W0FG49_MONRR